MPFWHYKHSITGMNSRPRVLVIDDDPLFRSLITSMLRRDFLVTVASEGAEGLHKALEFPPQLAIIDVQMPGWDGLRTVQAMRAHHGLAKVPVMMLTSDASRQTVLASIQAGANDYVIKTTLNRDDLLEKTRRLMRLDQADATPGVAKSSATELVTSAVASGEILEPATPPSGGPAAGDIEASMLQAMVDNWE